MLSISARSATPADIRAYLEGERDGANRGAEDYYTESGRTASRWIGSGAAELGQSHRRHGVRRRCIAAAGTHRNRRRRIGTRRGS